MECHPSECSPSRNWVLGSFLSEGRMVNIGASLSRDGGLYCLVCRNFELTWEPTCFHYIIRMLTKQRRKQRREAAALVESVNPNPYPHINGIFELLWKRASSMFAVPYVWVDKRRCPSHSKRFHFIWADNGTRRSEASVKSPSHSSDDGTCWNALLDFSARILCHNGWIWIPRRETPRISRPSRLSS